MHWARADAGVACGRLAALNTVVMECMGLGVTGPLLSATSRFAASLAQYRGFEPTNATLQSWVLYKQPTLQVVVRYEERVPNSMATFTGHCAMSSREHVRVYILPALHSDIVTSLRDGFSRAHISRFGF